MNATVKAVKTWRTDDGGGWQADLFVDGRKAALVTDEGTGGCLRWQVLNVEAVEAFATSCGVAQPFAGRSAMVMCDTEMDIEIAKLVDAHEQAKQIKRWCRSATLFTVPGDEAGSYRTIKAKYAPAVKAHILGKYPNAVILNEAL